MTDAPKNIIDNYEQILPGVFTGVPGSVYHASDGFSRSNLCEIDRSIAHYKISLETKNVQTDPLLKGSAFHDLCLLPDFYYSNYKVADTGDKRTKKYKTFVSKYPNNDILTPGMANDVKDMRDAIYSNPKMKEALDIETSLREVSIWARDPDTGLLLKIRPDLICDGLIIDLKSTISPSKEAFVYSVRDWKYHVQASYYLYVSSLIGMDIEDFIFFVVGSKPPFLTGIYNLPRLKEDVVSGPDVSLEEGERFFRHSLDVYKKYSDSPDNWDGLEYGRDLVTL